MKNMIRLALTLAAYTVVACVGLAFVYNKTEPVIEEAATREVKAALSIIFPDASDFDEVTGKIESGNSSISFDRAYVAKKGDGAVGMVIQVTGPTYKSSTLLIGIDMNRKITSVKFTANSDTPGLGSRTAESPFIDQFPSKSVDDSFKVGSDIVAISGATISSKAVSSIIKLTGYKAGEYLADNYGGKPGDPDAVSTASNNTPEEE